MYDRTLPFILKSIVFTESKSFQFNLFLNDKDSTKYNIAVFLQQEILKRTGIELAIKSKDEYCTTPQVKLVQDSNVKTFESFRADIL